MFGESSHFKIASIDVHMVSKWYSFAINPTLTTSIDSFFRVAVDGVFSEKKSTLLLMLLKDYVSCQLYFSSLLLIAFQYPHESISTALDDIDSVLLIFVYQNNVHFTAIRQPDIYYVRFPCNIL